MGCCASVHREDDYAEDGRGSQSKHKDSRRRMDESGEHSEGASRELSLLERPHDVIPIYSRGHTSIQLSGLRASLADVSTASYNRESASFPLVPVARTSSLDRRLSTSQRLVNSPQTALKHTQRLVVDQVKGNVFINEYLIIKDLGRGAHGTVKLVYNTEDDMLYAMKVVVHRRQTCKAGQVPRASRMASCDGSSYSRPYSGHITRGMTSGPLSFPTFQSQLFNPASPSSRASCSSNGAPVMDSAASTMSGSAGGSNISAGGTGGRLRGQRSRLGLIQASAEPPDTRNPGRPRARVSVGSAVANLGHGKGQADAPAHPRSMPRMQEGSNNSSQHTATSVESSMPQGPSRLNAPQPANSFRSKPMRSSPSEDRDCARDGSPYRQVHPMSLPIEQTQHRAVPHCLSSSLATFGSATASRSGSRHVLPAVQLDVSRQPSAWSQVTEDSNEIAVMKELDHPNVVRLYEVITHPSNDKLMMIMEYVEGGCVLEGPTPTSKVPIKEDVARRYFRDMLQGLEYLHFNSIVHGDLKPDNLLLTISAKMKISDFGSARLCDADDMLLAPAGTPAFMAPEMCTGKPFNGFIGDIWALGICLYMFVYGVPPFTGKTSFQVYEAIQNQPLVFPKGDIEISTELQHLLTRLLTKNPARRAGLPEVMQHVWVTDHGRLPLMSSKEQALGRVCELLRDRQASRRSLASAASATQDHSTAHGYLSRPKAEWGHGPHGTSGRGSNVMTGHPGVLGDATELLGETELHDLLPGALEREYQDGEHVIRQGEVSEGLFLILKGSCDLVRRPAERKVVADADFADALDHDEDEDEEDMGSEAMGALSSASGDIDPMVASAMSNVMSGSLCHMISARLREDASRTVYPDMVQQKIDEDQQDADGLIMVGDFCSSTRVSETEPLAPLQSETTATASVAEGPATSYASITSGAHTAAPPAPRAPLQSFMSMPLYRLNTNPTNSSSPSNVFGTRPEHLVSNSGASGSLFGSLLPQRGSVTSTGRIMRAVERSKSMQQRMLDMVMRAKQHASNETHEGSKLLVCHRGPGTVIGDICLEGQRPRPSDSSAIARGSVKMLLIPHAHVKEHRMKPLVRVALTRSANALLVQEAMERFAECEKEVRFDRKIRSHAARIWLDAESFESFSGQAIVSDMSAPVIARS